MSSTLACAKCGAPAPGGALACPSCGGALAKACSRCQFRNSLAKNYCDSCGTELNLTCAPTAEGIPETEVKNKSAVPGAPAGLPAAGRSAQSFEVPVPDPVRGVSPAASTRHTRETVPSTGLFPSGLVYWVQSALALALVAALAGGAVLLWMNLRHAHRPQTFVPKLAETYLSALQNGDFKTAYDMLSTPSRTSLTVDEFTDLRARAPWSWSNVELIADERDAITLQYDLAVEGRPVAKDYLLFVREGDAWVRPYNWHVLKKVESEFERGATDMALIRAQEAVRLNPRDAMARGYLCEAVYYRKVIQEIEGECTLAITLNRVYPSKLSPKSLYHLHAILGDNYKNALGRHGEAIEQYNAMMSFPNLSGEDRCELLLARADSLSALGKRPEAAADLREARPLCKKPADLQFIRRKLAQLSGDAR